MAKVFPLHRSNAFFRGFMIALGTIALAACGGDPQARQAAAAQALLQADQHFAEASLESGTADAFYANLTDDALELTANGAPIRGRTAIREHLRPMGLQVLSWKPQHADVAASLDMGWSWGEWQLLVSARSGKEIAHGKYMNIWRREPGGAWKVAVDMGNVADPASAPTSDAPEAMSGPIAGPTSAPSDAPAPATP